MMFSNATLELFATLLDQVKLSAQDPHLEESAAVVAQARRELDAALAAPDTDD